ncbi:hypothetical protein SAMN03159423_4890 [Bradyrhizobium sp. NFR13]|uniref:Pam3-gp28 family putative phage holin n=1 Tax=Bradyrhizobium sp. NFR13 TaxID=1566285 RepID=UPI0008F167F0|nr:hypothetical protein [Bradyrhizobium sp. NFR13]SFM00900.1 hypothetical protein SAMN03159423_4890 [Bradyrhizobium sp. NFR13]
MTDQFWQTLRYILIGIGMFLAGRGIIPAEHVATLVDSIINIGPGLVALGVAIWGLVVKKGTATVPASTAARPDVPTVSAATGAVTS